ncbi:hypothetical protein WH50_05065 [Pokkaliibacter plantistimulans]|uniref:DUF7939 domain-containing protein n=1 Tax=Pokkaliibacter plantistimulans TaxID=1635171 RepID=A0ABX5M3K0_9GAMM|nr:BatD family protein [Pokkaliibacter plantistimulans]PXF32288.1 hypothetical protein WH50_05065 [Pokkaliibacter plantistimulans]
MSRKALLFASGIWMFSASAFAEVTAELAQSNVRLGETVTLTLMVSGAVVDQPPQLASLNRDFDVLGSRANSVFRYANNSMQKTTRWQVQLKPRQTGALNIPPIKVGNESSESLQLNVNASASVTFGNEVTGTTSSDNGDSVQQTGGYYADSNGNSDSSDGSSDANKPEDAALTEEQQAALSENKETRKTTTAPAVPLASFDIEFKEPPHLMPGMPIKVMLHLNHQGSLLPAARIIPPDLGDARLVELNNPAPFVDETLDGRKIRHVQRNYLLYIDTAGTYTLPAFNFVGNVQTEDGNAQTASLSTAPHNFNLQEAAASPLNPAYDLQMDASWNQPLTNLKPGDRRERTLNIKISGLPSASLQLPPLPQIDGVTIDQGIASHNDITSTDGIESTLSVVQRFTFNKPGRFTLPDWQLNWWNINTSAMDNLPLPAQTADVQTPGAATASDQNTDTTSGAITTRLAPPGVDGQTTEIPLQSNQPTANPSSLLWPALAALALMLALLVAGRAWWLSRKVHRLEGYLDQLQQQQEEKKQIANESEIYEELALLCHANQPKLAKLKLIEWGQCVWPGEGVATLQDIREHAKHPTLNYVLEDLESALIAAEERTPYEWHSDLLLQMLNEIRHRIIRAKTDAMLQFNALT